MPESPVPLPAQILSALGAWEGLESARIEPLPGGLVNTSYAVHTPQAEYVAQRVNPIFSPRIHDNIEAVTRHLARRGEPTIELVPTRDGRLYVDQQEQGCVRLIARLSGRTFDVCQSASQAHSAGELIGRFHDALADFAGELHPLGFPYHDTRRHLADLREALSRHPEHPLHADVSCLAASIFDTATGWSDSSGLPRCVIHGDLKFSNVLFEGDTPPASERATTLIDLDTLCQLPLYYDLGDAWRSWCNVRGENSCEAELVGRLFEASAEGYLSARSQALSHDELVSFAEALERLSLEVCARFAADVLYESYFAWDAERFASAAEHNWVRARGQWDLHEQARATRNERLRFLLG